MSRSHEAILFDLDGTLLDCHPTHFRVFQKTFRFLGIELSTPLYQRVYSPNWYQSYAALGLPPQIWKRVDRLWLDEIQRHSVETFPGVRDLLAGLTADFRLGLVTAGTGWRVRRDLQRHGLAEFFDVIVTGDDVANPKPHPEGLQRAIDQMQVDLAAALYVGDSEVDLAMADSLGVAFVAVASPVSKFAPSAALTTVEKVTDLPTVLG